MVNKEFFAALKALENEKRISQKMLIESLEAGLASAYKKEFGESRTIAVRINDEKQTIKVYVYRQIVAEVEDPDKEIELSEARQIKPNCKLGEVLIEDITPKNFSRIAAQTAKQVVMQRINDAKRDQVFAEMSEKEGEIMNAIIRRKEGANIFVEMTVSQMEGILMLADQIPTETYNVNDTIKVYIKKVRTTNRGAQVVVSRSSAGFVKRMFEMEVPEIRSGLVSIKSIVREAGYRTKLAVAAEDPNVDAIGACIGNKGVRVNAIVAELGGEKIDVIEWCSDPLEFISRALSPAKVLMVSITEDAKSAKVIVPDDKLSLAIGKQGQNARLAAKLTGWKIDVKPYSSIVAPDAQAEGEEAPASAE
ncbi:MAG: transcription termination factor NusA [Christensenellales bacterium]|jgi:N utilization substance protein A|nr:transcription termination factor NusA [Clostridia bacterium]HRU84099.1 transcription termination factor NusA [Eubacteriales bacterium]